MKAWYSYCGSLLDGTIRGRFHPSAPLLPAIFAWFLLHGIYEISTPWRRLSVYGARCLLLAGGTKNQEKKYHTPVLQMYHAFVLLAGMAYLIKVCATVVFLIRTYQTGDVFTSRYWGDWHGLVKPESSYDLLATWHHRYKWFFFPLLAILSLYNVVVAILHHTRDSFLSKRIAKLGSLVAFNHWTVAASPDVFLEVVDVVMKEQQNILEFGVFAAVAVFMTTLSLRYEYYDGKEKVVARKFYSRAFQDLGVADTQSSMHWYIASIAMRDTYFTLGVLFTLGIVAVLPVELHSEAAQAVVSCKERDEAVRRLHRLLYTHRLCIVPTSLGLFMTYLYYLPHLPVSMKEHISFDRYGVYRLTLAMSEVLFFLMMVGLLIMSIGDLTNARHILMGIFTKLSMPIAVFLRAMFRCSSKELIRIKQVTLLCSRNASARQWRGIFLMAVGSLCAWEMPVIYMHVCVFMVTTLLLLCAYMIRDEVYTMDDLVKEYDPKTGASQNIGFGLVVDSGDFVRCWNEMKKTKGKCDLPLRTYKGSYLRMKETLAVSYRWQGAEQKLTSMSTMEPNMSVWQLDQICSAVNATRLPYLWIDKICIPQPESWPEGKPPKFKSDNHHEVQKELLVRMLAVYGCAPRTLVLRSAEEDRSRYHQRAWTFQEYACANGLLMETQWGCNVCVGDRRAVEDNEECRFRQFREKRRQQAAEKGLGSLVKPMWVMSAPDQQVKEHIESLKLGDRFQTISDVAKDYREYSQSVHCFDDEDKYPALLPLICNISTASKKELDTLKEIVLKGIPPEDSDLKSQQRVNKQAWVDDDGVSVSTEN